jgi:endoglucanase
MVLIHAYILTKEEKYLNAATAIIDYILGRNPLDLSYLTGYGVNSAKDPHHRPSQADGIEAPVPGMLVGGPNFTANDCAKKYVQKDAVAKSYYDNSCSYATNEVAINWNAPFAYVIGSLQAISSTGKAYDITTVPAKFLEVEGIKETRNIQKQVSVGSKLVIRNGAVQVKKTNREGKVQYFNIGGKRIR